MANLNIPINEELLSDTTGIEDPIMKAIKKYENHPSIIEIKKNFTSHSNFSFQNPSMMDIEKQVRNLDSEKTSQKSDIPTKLLKEIFSTIFSQFIHTNINSCLL